MVSLPGICHISYNRYIPRSSSKKLGFIPGKHTIFRICHDSLNSLRGRFASASTSCTEYLATGSYVHSLDMITIHFLQFTSLLSGSVQYSQVAL